jgi:sugar/nucleoside kinase (ribokinase family)
VSHGEARRPVVVALGDLLLDVSCRLSGPVREGTDTASLVSLDAGGQAANTAAWAVAAGARGRLVARRSSAPAGRLAEERIAARGVEVRGALVDRPAGAVVVLVRPDGGRDMLTDRGGATLLGVEDVGDDVLDGARAVHVTGYVLEAEPMIGAATRLAALASAADVPLAADLSSVALLEAVGVERFAERVAALAPTVLLGTTAELACIGGPASGRRLARYVLEKRGADGARLHGDAAVVDVPAVATTVVDTTGAGDALAGAFLAALAAGRSPLDALRDAVPYAARCVATVGALPAAGAQPSA